MHSLLSLMAACSLAGAELAPDSNAVAPYDRTVSTYTAERFPSWLKVSGEFRARVEGRTGFNFEPDNNDAYGLFRTRVNVDLLPASWLQIYFQGQDSRAPGLDAGRPAATMRDPFDVRQAFIRLGEGAVKLTAGRQLLNYGAQRLLGPLDWTNTSRNWDAVKLELGNPNSKVDLFASSVVQVDPARRVNRHRDGFNLHGAYGSFKKVVPKAVFEPYLLWKTGGVSIGSGGFRLAVMPGTQGLHGFDYQTEVIRQWGRVGALDHSAWAAYGISGYTIGSHSSKPHVSVEYSYASGNRDANDSTHRTFDHLLGTNHLFYGLVDAIGWQNTRNVRIGADAKPNKRLQLNADYHWLWLASAGDALYDVAGRATVRPKAGNTEKKVGTELDFTATWTASRQWKIGGGVGHLFAGEFLKRNAPGSGQTFPYLFAQYSF